jgi:hypothetical protein
VLEIHILIIKFQTTENAKKLSVLEPHPSDARILIRATTSPGLGFLERALPITESYKNVVTIINPHMILKSSYSSSKSW